MPEDRFENYSKSLNSPGSCHWLIVPSDTDPLDRKPRAIYCAVEGIVVVVDDEGRDLAYAMSAGQVLDFRPTTVRATGTTATVYGWD